jgi:hypothetical protein
MLLLNLVSNFLSRSSLKLNCVRIVSRPNQLDLSKNNLTYRKKKILKIKLKKKLTEKTSC